jgi:hypothetical protein
MTRWVYLFIPGSGLLSSAFLLALLRGAGDGNLRPLWIAFGATALMTAAFVVPFVEGRR